MDHAAPTPADLVRPWRTAALVLTGVAAVELLLLLGAGAALVGRHLVSHGAVARHARKHVVAAKPRAAVRIPRRQPVGTPKLARRELSVLVLNGNGLTGAAGAEARRIRSRGYRISRVGNASRTDYGRSVVIYRPGFRAEGFRLGRDLRVGLVTPLDGLRLRALGRAQLVVVVGG